MTDKPMPDTPATGESATEPAGRGFGDLPIQPTGSGVADLEIAYEQMKVAEGIDDPSLDAGGLDRDQAIPTDGADAVESEAYPS